MPDFAPNVTGRYRLRYNAVGRVHTIQVRVARGLSLLSIQDAGATYIRPVFLALAAALVSDFLFISATAAETDSDLFFPVAIPTQVVGLAPIADYSKQDSITHLTFSGRGASGSKVNQKIYGFVNNPDQLPPNVGSDFVLLSSESPLIQNAVNAFNSPGASIVAIDNSVPVYVQRATIKINDFWLRQVRKGL